LRKLVLFSPSLFLFGDFFTLSVILLTN
jgi:hypothetical protein